MDTGFSSKGFSTRYLQSKPKASLISQSTDEWAQSCEALDLPIIIKLLISDRQPFQLRKSKLLSQKENLWFDQQITP